jgi:hypothetical protein
LSRHSSLSRQDSTFCFQRGCTCLNSGHFFSDR